MKILSYHGDEGLKSLIVAEMERHREQDQFVKGTYGTDEDDNFKGCAVGCAINSLNKILNKSCSTYDHAVFEEELGIPVWLARLQDCIFENLPNGECSKFAVDFLSSILVGVDLEPVKWKFCSYLIRENIDRVMNLNIDEDLRLCILNALREVLSIHDKAIESNVWDINAAESARTAARTTAESARSTAESTAYQCYAEEILRLLKNQKGE